MKQSISIMVAAAAVAMAAPPATASSPLAYVDQADNIMHLAQDDESHHRQLGRWGSPPPPPGWHGPPKKQHHGHWGPPPPPGYWHGSSSSSSGKSGKSGGYSGKSGKSGGSSSSSSSSNDHGPPFHPGWHGLGWQGRPGSSSSSSSSSSGKSGKSGGSSSSGSGKSGKSGGSGSSSSSLSNDGTHSHGHWVWHFKPSSSSSSYSGKSGKGSKSKSGKGSKGSSSSSSSSPDGFFMYQTFSHKHSSSSSSSSWEAPPPPDSSSPGICAPSFDEGGLECDEGDWDYCTSVGDQAECGPGYTCYNKRLCPELSKHDPVGVCETAVGTGLECEEVTTYCSKPGYYAECGAGRKCYDSGLCGLGPHGDGDYAGVCGFGKYKNDGHKGLDCEKVTTMCTRPGKHAECAYGARCFDADMCVDTGDHAGFCGGGSGSGWSSDGHDGCGDASTFCAYPGKGGQCPLGETCVDSKVCDPPVVIVTPSPSPKPKPKPKPPVALREVCFIEGEIVDCDGWYADGWGSDGHGNYGGGWGDDGHEDDDSKASGDDGGGKNSGDDYTDGWASDGHDTSEMFTVPFTYTVDTNGKADPDDVITSLENAILDDVADYVEDNDEFSSFTGKISASPADYIADDDFCGDGTAVRCSVVKGEMGFFVDESTWEGDGHGIDACSSFDIIEASMEGNDYTEVDGVTNVKYRNSDDPNCGMIVGAGMIYTPEDKRLSAGTAFGLLLAAAALVALLFLLAKRRKPEPPREEFPLTDSLTGDLPRDNPYGSPIDVHKCSSHRCEICNKMKRETSFLPVPRKVDLTRTMRSNGISPTSVNQTDSFFGQESQDGSQQNSAGSIMRVPIRSQMDEDSRALPPVNEIPHDSEIDTELESVADQDADGTTIPPPPPLELHPAYGRTESSDELSI